MQSEENHPEASSAGDHDTAMRSRNWFLNQGALAGVQGYLQETQATALHALLECQRQSSIGGSLVEVGVFLGKTLIGLVRNSLSHEYVFGIDPLQIGTQNLEPQLLRNLSANLTKAELGRVKIVRDLSTNLGARDWINVLGTAPRFVHLDGHHARSTILHDVSLAASWLPKGGLVVIDDFLNELHPDLTSGIIDALTAHQQLEPVAVIPRMGHIEEGGSKLVCCTRGDAAQYRDVLDMALAGHLRPWTDRLNGQDVRVYRSKAPAAAQLRPTTRHAVPSAASVEPNGKRIAVVFALEDKSGLYWMNTAVAMTSVVQNARRPIQIHVLHDNTLGSAAAERFEKICKSSNVPITLTQVITPREIDVDKLGKFGRASIYRLMIPELFNKHELVIYLDSDLVANGIDVTDLIQESDPARPLTGVIDPFIAVPNSHAMQLQSLNLDPLLYINSGVLLMRPALIEDSLTEAFVSFIQDNPTATHPDQDFLNSYFKDKIGIASERFNYQVNVYEHRFLMPLANYQGKMLHYAGKLKPLDGLIAPGLIPFWTYTQFVEEISNAPVFQTPSRYLVEVANETNSLYRQRTLSNF